ncbi:integration host factor subunit alpha [bacterium]|nr:integration host factor subunit alpha [bacterium]
MQFLDNTPSKILKNNFNNIQIPNLSKQKQEHHPLSALTKITIIEKISEEINQSPPKAKDTVEHLLEIIKSTLASGEDVMISGFGKFQVNEKAPRKGRNPATGRDMILEKRRVVTFKCAGVLRDRVNGQDQ